MLLPPPPPPSNPRPPAAEPAPDDVSVIMESLEKGARAADVRKHLIALGYDAQHAERVVQNAVRWRGEEYASRGIDLNDPDSVRAAGNRQVILGLVLCGLGVFITVGSCLMASHQGGYFIVTGGLITGGIGLIYRGNRMGRSGSES